MTPHQGSRRRPLAPLALRASLRQRPAQPQRQGPTGVGNYLATSGDSCWPLTVATWLQISDTRKATDRTLRLTSAQQETERFTRAVEQLGSDRVEVRVGGI